MLKYISVAFAGLLLLVALIGFESPVFAQTDLRGQINDQVRGGASGAGLGAPVDPRVTIANIIKVFLSLLGMIFTVLILLAGFWYITAKGDDAKVEKAKDTISAAITGLIIVLAAYSITTFVTKKFTAAVQEGATTLR